jgi:hypothetical protein
VKPAGSGRLLDAWHAAAAAFGVALAASLVGGCAAPGPVAPPPGAAVQAGAARFIVLRLRPLGGFAEVGRLTLQPDGRGELTIAQPGADADRLQQAWDQVSRRPALRTKVHGSNDQLVGRSVARGAPGYVDAVADVMSREFGFFLSPIAGTAAQP